ncbi:MAG: AmmeMemoRadiSam system protein B [Elusimicrobiota bacterium]
MAGFIRKAMYAGSWYPSVKGAVKNYIIPDAKKREVIGCIIPHAGWMFSGKIMGEVFSGIEPPETFVILSPNHTGLGESVSILPEGGWDTPSGIVQTDEVFADKLLACAGVLKADKLAHLQEHSIEVLLPFIKYMFTESKIVPISFYDYSFDVCDDIGNAIADVIAATSKKVVVIASTDMSHHVTQKVAEEKDKLAIEQITKMNPKKMLEVIEDNEISMCGSGPVAAMLITAKKMGAKNVEIVKHATSGDVTHDYDVVVGYLGAVVY